MPKKKSTKKTKPKRQTRRRKKSQNNLVKIISFFFVFVLFSVLGLFYLKSQFNNSDEVFKKNTVLNSRIEEVDKALKEILFNQGISSKDLGLKVSEKSSDEIKWKFQEGRAKLKNFNAGSLSSELKKLSVIENVSLNISEKKNDLTAELSVLGYKTHRLDFVLKQEKQNIKANTKKIEAKLKNTKKEVFKTKEEPVKVSNKEKPKIIIIVDDVGQTKSSVDMLSKIDYPINFAILPHLPFSGYAAKKAHSSGKEVLLHLPMEPKYSSGYTAEDAGKGALLVGHSKTQIENQLLKNLKAFPYIKGVNNHMGSKFTENEELMKLVFENLKDNDLYFVDSLTSSKSSAGRLAKKMGLKFTKRDVFLDDSKKGKWYMIKQLESLVKIAEKKGVGVGICHTYPESIEVLSEYLPKIKDRVEIATLTTIFK